MQQKRAIVTGGTGAIGKAIAYRLAFDNDLSLTIISRNEEKAQKTVEEIKHISDNDNIDYVVADLSRESQVKGLAESWEGPLHILVNNAAISPVTREETPEGIELQWATNVLAYYWMIKNFYPHLKESGNARVVNVASYWAGGLDFSDLEFKKRNYDNDVAYRQSKQANRMLTAGFSEIFSRNGVTVNSVHPGDVNSVLSNNLGYGGHESPDEGADTPVWAATSPELEGVSGKYFEHRSRLRCRFGEDQEAVLRLMRILEDA